MDESGLIFSAENEIRQLLAKSPAGMTIKEINDKSYSYHKLTKQSKQKSLELLTKSGIVTEYKIMKGFGCKPETLFHHLINGPINKYMGFNIVKSSDYSEIVTTVRNKDVAGTIKVINEKMGDKMNFVSSGELKKQAEQLLKAAEVAERRENDIQIKQNVTPLQLTIAKSVVAIQKHVDGLVDAMSDLEKASEALRKALAN